MSMYVTLSHYGKKKEKRTILLKNMSDVVKKKKVNVHLAKKVLCIFISLYLSLQGKVQGIQK